MLSVVLLGAPDAFAGKLKNRIRVLERHIEQLSRDVERDRAASTISDDVVNNVADLEVRLTRLDDQIRGLVGQLERQDFLLQQLQQKPSVIPEKMIKRNPGFPSSPSPVSVVPSTDDSLGRMSKQDLDKFLPWKSEAAPSVTPSSPSRMNSFSPAQDYKSAFALLGRGKYQKAEQAFSRFVASYPKHALAGNAQYWLSETYYVRGQLEQAAIAFAEGYKTYPKSTKSPDNLLKLAMSLSQLGRSQDACLAYQELKNRYPKADSNIKAHAEQGLKQNNCLSQ